LSTAYPSGWTRLVNWARPRSTTGQGDPVERIRRLRRKAGLPIGEEAMDGVHDGIDAVGFQAHDRAGPGAENPTQVFYQQFGHRANVIIKAVLCPG
jgi:hypothetical protein